MKDSKSNNMLMQGFILVTILATAKSAEAEITMEAAFQGHCGHTSPCEQLCYEIHDGMYECDCIEGYELNKNGYSCQVINATANGDTQTKSDEDVLYQKGASFSAKLANNNEQDNQLNNDKSFNKYIHSPAAGLENVNDVIGISDESISIDSDSNSYEELERLLQQEQKVDSNDYYISGEENFNLSKTRNPKTTTRSVEKIKTTSRETTKHSIKPFKVNLNSKFKQLRRKSKTKQTTTSPIVSTTTQATLKTATATRTSSSSPYELNLFRDLQDDFYNNRDMSIYDDVNNNQLNLKPLSQNTYQQRYTTDTNAKSNLNWKLIQSDNKIESPTISNISIVTSSTEMESESCNLNCGPDGYCDNTDGLNKCLCMFGKTGINCSKDIKVRIPKFSGKSWIAFPALRGAYKHVQLRIEFRPESFDGIIFLSGERDDLTGDFMALLLNKGFVEFWFDCGSGVGSVRSRETIMLNEWNSVIIYRHRWDAWIVLNHGTKSQGRSNGLFSRITFREPVFLGGVGNITGLAKRLPSNTGFIGCIRRFVANDHDYKFDEHPSGDITKGFDIQDCITDKCFKYPCEHGGKCLPSEQGAVCLCPIGFVGDLCEIRLDLQIPAFNGSSYLRYAPLSDSALIWLELKVILKPEQTDGIILYSGPKKHGDFIALSLNNGYVEFAFDLGSGKSVVRSEYPLTIGQWHIIKVSRTARLAVLKIDQAPEVMTISSNGFWHLSLPHNLFVGGLSHVDKLPYDLKFKAFFVGCIQKIEINGHSLGIVSEALGGTNIGNCPHACLARPCGPLAECVPHMESYECRCNAYTAQCNKAAEVPLQELELNKARNNSKTLDTMHKNPNFQLNESKQRTFPIVADELKLKKIKKHNKERKLKPKVYTSKYAQINSLKVKSSTIKTSMTNVQPTTTVEQNYNKEYIDQPNHQTNSPKHTFHKKKFIQSKSASDSDIQQKLQHEKHPLVGHKLSRLPTHYESFQTNPDSDILTFDDNIDWIAQMEEGSNENNEQSFEDDKNLEYIDSKVKPEPFIFDETLFDNSDGTEDYQRKQLAQDMQRIMTNEHERNIYTTTTTRTNKVNNKQSEYDYFEEQHMKSQQHTYPDSNDYLSMPIATRQFENNHEEQHQPVQEQKLEYTTPQTYTDWSVLKKFELSSDHQSTIGVRKNFGACFSGVDSYFHYNDAETMSQIISNNIDLNLRIKTHSTNGIILSTGRQGTAEADVYLSLGIEEGYLHFRFDLGSGEVDIKFNVTKVSDGLWHRVRAIRNLQEGFLEVDSRKTQVQQLPGKLRQLSTDTGLYVGGMPDVLYFTRRKYTSGIVGCISEIVLAGELKLNFDPNTLGTAHNVETGIL